MNKRTQYKLRRLHVFLKRDVFTSHYIVRNTLAVMAMASVIGVASLSVTAMSAKDKGAEAQVSSYEQQVEDAYVIQTGEASSIDGATISILKAEFVEPDMDKAAVDIQSVASSEEENDYDMICQTDGLNIRAEGDTDSEILGKLMEQSVGHVLEESDGWLKISSGGITGYVKAEYLLYGEDAIENMSSCKKNLATVTGSEVRVRSEASTDGQVLFQAEYGEVFAVEDTYSNSQWTHIRLVDGSYGYISSDYISISAGYEEAISIERINAFKEKLEQTAQQQAAQNSTSTEESKKDKTGSSTAGNSRNEESTSGSNSTSNNNTSGNNSTSGNDSTSSNNSTSNSGNASNSADSTTETTTEAPATDNSVTVGTTQRGSFGLSDEDMHLLACIVYAESGGESYEGQLAVANVVLNRLQSGKWGSSISDVIYAKNQFSAVNTTTFANALAGSPSSTSQSAAQAAASGTNNIGSFLSFRQVRIANTSSYSSYTIIGNHCFY